MNSKYQKGEKVVFKKKHPCGGNEWNILKVGMKFKIECDSCGRIITMSRKKFEKSIKK